MINFGGNETDLIPVIAEGQSWPMTPAIPDRLANSLIQEQL